MKAKTLPGWCLSVLIFLAACQAPPTGTPAPTILAPTVTRPAPTTAPTRTPPPAPTATASPTDTPIPTITSTPTRSPSEAFWENLERYPLTSASTVGPGGFLYTVYVMSGPSPHDECHLYFVRSNGRENQLIHEVAERSFCDANDWEELRPSYSTRQALRLNGFWSDLNNNGQPELTVFHFSGCVSCDEANGGRYAVYEIQGVNRITDITAPLPGTIFPTYVSSPDTPEILLHSADPLTIYGYQWFMYTLHEYVDMAWIYAWDGDRYVDVSRDYLEEYRQQVETAVARLRESYGQSLTSRDIEAMQRILVTYNELGFPQDEGLALFLEVTDPTHWPGANLCWLQVARAQAIMDEEAGRRFELRPTFVIGPASDAEQAEAMKSGIPERFDVSACQ